MNPTDPRPLDEILGAMRLRSHQLARAGDRPGYAADFVELINKLEAALAVEPAPMGTRAPWTCPECYTLIPGSEDTCSGEEGEYGESTHKTVRRPIAAGGVTGASECQHGFHDRGPRSEAEGEHGCPACGEWWAHVRKAAAAEQPTVNPSEIALKLTDAAEQPRTVGLDHPAVRALTSDPGDDPDAWTALVAGILRNWTSESMDRLRRFLADRAAPEGSPVASEEAECPHEAWEEIGGSRKCADCGDSLPPAPVAGPRTPSQRETLDEMIDGVRYDLSGPDVGGPPMIEVDAEKLRALLAALRTAPQPAPTREQVEALKFERPAGTNGKIAQTWYNEAINDVLRLYGESAGTQGETR